MNMKKYLLAIVLFCALSAAALAEGCAIGYRFADAGEAAALLLSNRAYYEGMNQEDLNFRVQKQGATLDELESLVTQSTRDFTEAEKSAIDEGMAEIMDICRQRGYTLPELDGIVFAKTTMAEESGAAAYTHGTQIYLGERLLNRGLSQESDSQALFRETLAHELFHCLTRSHPEFRAAMYGILGFAVAGKDYEFSSEISDRIIANPDVEHHDAFASFEIGGERLDCVVVFLSGQPFKNPGDSFFDEMVTGLVPVDDLSKLYTSDDAANFRDVFGWNTDYVIDPEETMADNFAFAVVYGLEGREYKTPEIIKRIDEILRH